MWGAFDAFGIAAAAFSIEAGQKCGRMKEQKSIRIPAEMTLSKTRFVPKRKPGFLPVFWAILLISWTLSSQAVERHVLNGHVPKATQGLVAVESLPAAERLELSIGLPLRNEGALSNLLNQIYDRTSPLYRHYLTPEEFTERFGPTEADYRAVIGFVESKGFTVVRKHPNRLLLDVKGSVQDIELAFGTRLRVYNDPTQNRKIFAPAIEPTVEVNLPLLDISGLDNFLVPHPALLRPLAATRPPLANAGSAPDGSYRGKDFRAAYLPGVVLTGVGQSVGLLEFDGYYANDIATYETQAGLPNVSLQNVLLNGFSGNPGANNAEVALDIEVAIAIAPGLSSVLVYEGSSANTLLNRMANENRAKQLSSSWTFGINATTENIFRQFATQGQSFFQASGDEGAYSGVVPTPADNPNLTIVGGTTLETSGAAGGWSTETTWNWASTGIGTGATGGGISASYAIPSYQKATDMSQNQGSTALRNFPDVAMTADNIWVAWDNGSVGAFGGTSAATPLWAGFMALVNQQSVANGHSTIGFANPSLYAIGNSTNYHSCFHDVVTGNNFSASSPDKFTAAAGYDLCTGWGTPAGQALINALSGGTNMPPTFNQDPFVIGPVNVGQPCSGSVSNQATDPNPAEQLSFVKLAGPAWLTIAPDGSLSGIPAVSDVGTNVFTVSVSEIAGMSNSATMYLLVNGAPVFAASSFSVPAVQAGESYSSSISNQATDPNTGSKLTFSKVSGPAWLTIASDGSLSGTPTASDVGTNLFLIKVTDAGGLAASATMNIPVLSTASDLTLRISLQDLSLRLNWSGGTPPYQAQVATNLVSWQNVGGPFTNTSLIVVPTFPAAIYRIRSTAP